MSPGTDDSLQEALGTRNGFYWLLTRGFCVINHFWQAETNGICPA